MQCHGFMLNKIQNWLGSDRLWNLRKNRTPKWRETKAHPTRPKFFCCMPSDSGTCQDGEGNNILPTYPSIYPSIHPLIHPSIVWPPQSLAWRKWTRLENRLRHLQQDLLGASKLSELVSQLGHPRPNRTHFWFKKGWYKARLPMCESMGPCQCIYM